MKRSWKKSDRFLKLILNIFVIFLYKNHCMDLWTLRREMFLSHWTIHWNNSFKTSDLFWDETSGFFLSESLNHSLNRFIQKHWFIQEQNTFELLIRLCLTNYFRLDWLVLLLEQKIDQVNGNIVPKM